MELSMALIASELSGIINFFALSGKEQCKSNRAQDIKQI